MSLVTSPAQLEASGLSLRVGRRTIQQRLSFAASQGVTCLVGRNGVGKTTLLRCLATLDVAAAGEVRFGGTNVRASGSELEEFRRVLGWMPQHVGVPRSASVEDAVRYSAWLKGPVDATGVDGVLERCSLTELRRRPLGQLSGGEVRRAMLAMALAARPKALLLDEPTVGLDPAQRLAFHDIVRTLKDTCVILSTHLMEDVEEVANSILLLTAQGIEDVGAPEAGGMSALNRSWRS